MVTESSIAINTGRYAMIHMALFIFLSILRSIYHIMLLAICTTQVKKRIKKKNKIMSPKIWVFEPGPSEYVRTENESLYPLDHLSKRYIFLLYGD